MTISHAGCAVQSDDGSAVEKTFGRTGLSPGEFSYPRAIAVSPVDGRVFVVDKTARVQRFSPDGEYEHGWRMPDYENGKPTGMAVDGRNRLWIADTHYFRVLVFDRDGNELLRFGSRGEGPGQFVFPCSIAVDAEGFAYVGEYGGNDRISKFTPDGVCQMIFADRSSGDGWVERPAGIEIGDDGDVWVADACHHRICRYDGTGRFLGSFGVPGAGPGQLNYPYDLALEEAGTVLVADRGNNRIVRFTGNGRFVAAWGSAGRGPGQIAQPWGVAVRADGMIYALDSWNNRVQLLDW